MSDLISKVRLMIGDVGTITFFADQDIQDSLDQTRDDIRYESMEIAPTIVNSAATGNVAQMIFADYYSEFEFWEADAVIQANYGGQSWIVITPTSADYITGHFQFENNVFTSGTAPGQYPPVYITGKIFDKWAAAADLLEMWGAALAGAYDIAVDGQNLRRSQMMQAKLNLAVKYRQRAKPRTMKMSREDIEPMVSITDQAIFLDVGTPLK